MDGTGLINHGPDMLRQRVAHAPDARAALIIADLAEAVTGVVAKHRVTRPELHAAMRFAVDVGAFTDGQRNEWVLLSDVLGVSRAVETAGLDRPDGATPQTLVGPFLREGAPSIPQGGCISIDGIGAPLIFQAAVVDLDGLPVAGATVDVWQANDQGKFENQDPDSQPEFNLRGQFLTDAAGVVLFRTVRPAGYALPHDGPVAALMGALGLSLQRPAHIQFRIAAAGFQTLVTHVFDKSDPRIDADPIFCVSPHLLADFANTDAQGESRVQFTFKLARSRAGTP